MKNFLKLVGTAYVGGIVGMWGFILVMLFFDPGFINMLNLISGIVLIPFTPLGLPFFIGLCVALRIREKKKKREDAILKEVFKTYRGM